MRGWKCRDEMEWWCWGQIMAVMMMMLMVTSTPTPMTIGTNTTRVGNTTDTVNAPRAIATATAAVTTTATAHVATSTIIETDRQSGRLPSGNRYNNTTISPSRISNVDASVGETTPKSALNFSTTSSPSWPWLQLVKNVDSMSENTIDDEDTDEKARPIASFPKYSKEFTNMFKQIVAISKQKSQYLWKVEGLPVMDDELQIGCEEGFTQVDNSSHSRLRKRRDIPENSPAQVVVVVVPYISVPSSNSSNSSNSSDFNCFLEAIQRLISHNQPIPINKRSEPNQFPTEFHKSRPPGVINREHQLDNHDNISLPDVQSSQNIHSPTVNREIIESVAPNATILTNTTSSSVSLLDMSVTQSSSVDCDINNLTSCTVKEKTPQNRRRRPPPEYPGPLPSPMENRGRPHTELTTMEMLAILNEAYNSTSSDPSPEPALTTVF